MTATFTKNPEIVKAQDKENNRVHRQTGCDGKENYVTWSAGERVARRARMKSRGAGVILAPYRCKFCGGVHLTTVDPLLHREQKRNRRHRSEEYDDGDE